jgi:hypothetical protein
LIAQKGICTLIGKETVFVLQIERFVKKPSRLLQLTVLNHQQELQGSKKIKALLKILQ